MTQGHGKQYYLLAQSKKKDEPTWNGSGSGVESNKIVAKPYSGKMNGKGTYQYGMEMLPTADAQMQKSTRKSMKGAGKSGHNMKSERLNGAAKENVHPRERRTKIPPSPVKKLPKDTYGKKWVAMHAHSEQSSDSASSPSDKENGTPTTKNYSSKKNDSPREDVENYNYNSNNWYGGFGEYGGYYNGRFHQSSRVQITHAHPLLQGFLNRTSDGGLQFHSRLPKATKEERLRAMCEKMAAEQTPVNSHTNVESLFEQLSAEAPAPLNPEAKGAMSTVTMLPDFKDKNVQTRWCQHVAAAEDPQKEANRVARLCNRLCNMGYNAEKPAPKYSPRSIVPEGCGVEVPAKVCKDTQSSTKSPQLLSGKLANEHAGAASKSPEAAKPACAVTDVAVKSTPVKKEKKGSNKIIN